MPQAEEAAHTRPCPTATPSQEPQKPLKDVWGVRVRVHKEFKATAALWVNEGEEWGEGGRRRTLEEPADEMLMSETKGLAREAGARRGKESHCIRKENSQEANKDQPCEWH